MMPEGGSVIAYNAGFERRCIRELAELFSDLAPALLSIGSRTVDLLPVVRACWYHPEQRGSWSIKEVLPSLVPEMSYASLEVGDGSAAQSAYLEATSPLTPAERRDALDAALRAYCRLDTVALVQVLHRLTAGPAQDA
jgi:hypothetical protein